MDRGEADRLSENPIGSVWWNDVDDFMIAILGVKEVCEDGLRLSAFVVDNGVWPTPAGGLYYVHTKSLHRYYARIA